MKAKNIIYTAAFLAVSLVPTIGMLRKEDDTSSENRTLAAMPSLKDESGKLNTDYLSGLGDYYQDHFGFRTELVTADAEIKSSVFGVSAQDSVIDGTDGWLYYSDSLDDYQGVNQLGDRGIFDLAHTLRMLQDYLDSRGVRFLFTVAPNKNTLYPEHMPYYLSKVVSEESNLERLSSALEKEGVNYVDLEKFFRDSIEASDDLLYHERDSHWNNLGAALAADQMMTALDKDHTKWQDLPCEVRQDFTGDLDRMLFPAHTTPENEIYYDQPTVFTYVGEVSSTFDPKIQTENGHREGSLVMYRDSFGNALVPLFADEYASAYFSRSQPYYMTDIDTCGADTVIAERAERFLPEQAQNPPVFAASLALSNKTVRDASADGVTDFKAQTQGMLVRLSGILDDDLVPSDTSRIYIRIEENSLYETFPVCIKSDTDNLMVSENGFVLYLNNNILQQPQKVEILVEDGDWLDIVYSTTVEAEAAG